MPPDLDDITANERIFLLALALRPGQRGTIRDLIAGNPAAFGNRNAQGLHGIAAGLARKGLVTRWSQPDGGAAVYEVTPAVLGQLAAGPPAMPPPGTPEFGVWVAALDVATSPPLRHAATTGYAQVPWGEIEKLRDALETAGLDWRAVREARHA
jgi:hypothetical protein